MVVQGRNGVPSPQPLPKPLSTTIGAAEVFASDLRLDASAYGIERRRAVHSLTASGLPLLPLLGEDGMCTWAAKVVRFRRVYVGADHGVPFLSSSDIISMRPEITNYLSKNLMRRLDEQIIQKWDLLISRSGTVGNVALAGLTHAGKALSEHAIRLRADTADAAGYASAFLRSRYGRPQLTGASYGSVVVHIEPSHLQRVLIPRLHPLRLAKIGGRMREACELRDRANALIDEADRLLHDRLRLRPLGGIPGPRRLYHVVRATRLQGRLEASFHDPVAEVAIKLLKDSGAEVTTMADPRVMAEIRPITKFRKRVYVPHGGIPLLGGKQLFQVDPIDVKGLAKGAHTKDLPEIALKEQMVLVTCSGTVGRVQIVPAYMIGWTANQHATRFMAAADMNPGYVYAWLASDYGTKLTTRHAYGSVILEVDKQMFGSVPIPLADAATRKEIGDLVLKANDCRDTAWQKEREAIAQIEAIVAGDASRQ